MKGSRKKAEIITKPRENFDSEPKSIFYDLIVIGAGVAGLAGAMYAQRLGVKTLVIGELMGGTVTLTETIENYPGFISVTGGKLAELMEAHARDYDLDILNAKVDKIKIRRKSIKRHFKVFVGRKVFTSKTVLVATGTKVRKLGVLGEKELENKGVSYCALCDGPLFKGKVVGVVGGSDSAVKEANLLTEYAKKVYIIYRKDKPRGELQNQKIMEEKIKKKKIEIIPNTNIKEIKGKLGVEKVVLDVPYNGKNELDLDGLFVYIGRLPINELVKPLKVRLNKIGEIKIDNHSATNMKGVYAAGDITDSEWKQAITGVAEGVKAAYYIYQYVTEDKYILPFRK